MNSHSPVDGLYTILAFCRAPAAADIIVEESPCVYEVITRVFHQFSTQILYLFNGAVLLFLLLFFFTLRDVGRVFEVIHVGLEILLFLLCCGLFFFLLFGGSLFLRLVIGCLVGVLCYMKIL